MRIINKIQSLLLLSVIVVSSLLITSPAKALYPEINFFWYEETTIVNEDILNATKEAVVSVNAYVEMPTYGVEYITRRGRVYAYATETGRNLEKVSTGSGFFVTSDGYLLTNKHVVSDTQAEYKIKSSDNSVEIPAVIVYMDPVYDIAVLKAEGNNFSTIDLGDSNTLEVGTSIFGIGNALGKTYDSTSYGVVISLDETISVNDANGFEETLTGVIETNAQLYPGDSGGPLLDKNGVVFGINTATVIGRRYHAGYSIPINIAREALYMAGINL